MIPESLKDPLFTFDPEKHLYYYDGKLLTGQSTWARQYKRPFDSAGQAVKSAKKRKTTPEALLKEWDEKRDSASALGDRVHADIERTLKTGEWGVSVPNIDSVSPEDEEVMKRYDLFRRLWEGRLKGATAVAFELQLFSLLYMIAGTADLLVRLANGKLYLGDWKTNLRFQVGSEGYGYLLPPFHRLKDNHLNIYAIQTAFYRIMLAEHGLEVDGGFIAWLGPGQTEPKVFFPPDLRPLVLSELNKGKTTADLLLAL